MPDANAVRVLPCLFLPGQRRNLGALRLQQSYSDPISIKEQVIGEALPLRRPASASAR